MRRRIIGNRNVGAGPYRAGPGGTCVCPKCGHKERHARGLACLERKCPECGTKMIREGVG